MLSNVVLYSLRTQLTKSLKSSNVRQLFNETNKSSFVAFKRLINTSDKKKGHSHDAVPSYVPGFMEGQPKGPKTVKDFADIESQKNWITYGWDIGNKNEDRLLNKWAFFVVVTLGTVIIPYIVMYYPDYKLFDWTVREAYLELDRRERLGLPLIDKNLIDPNLLELPSEEELGDTEVYI